MTAKVIKKFALLIFTLAFTNCATIIHGSRQQVTVVSEPQKAKIDIDGIEVGRTPFLANLARNSNHLIKLEIEGYAPYEITLKRKLDGWIFGNIIFGGIIGIAVDVATGGMYKLTPTDITAAFSSPSIIIDKTGSGIYLSVVLCSASNWDKIGQLKKTQLLNNGKQTMQVALREIMVIPNAPLFTVL